MPAEEDHSKYATCSRVHECLNRLDGVFRVDRVNTFRWYFDNAPLSRVNNVRVALRRWIANANGSRFR